MPRPQPPQLRPAGRHQQRRQHRPHPVRPPHPGHEVARRRAGQQTHQHTQPHRYQFIWRQPVQQSCPVDTCRLRAGLKRHTRQVARVPGWELPPPSDRLSHQRVLGREVNPVPGQVQPAIQARQLAMNQQRQPHRQQHPGGVAGTGREPPAPPLRHPRVSTDQARIPAGPTRGHDSSRPARLCFRAMSDTRHCFPSLNPNKK